MNSLRIFDNTLGSLDREILGSFDQLLRVMAQMRKIARKCRKVQA